MTSSHRQGLYYFKFSSFEEATKVCQSAADFDPVMLYSSDRFVLRAETSVDTVDCVWIDAYHKAVAKGMSFTSIPLDEIKYPPATIKFHNIGIPPIELAARLKSVQEEFHIYSSRTADSLWISAIPDEGVAMFFVINEGVEDSIHLANLLDGESFGYSEGPYVVSHVGTVEPEAVPDAVVVVSEGPPTRTTKTTRRKRKQREVRRSNLTRNSRR